MMEIEKPRITCEETDNGTFARFVVEPLDVVIVLTPTWAFTPNAIATSANESKIRLIVQKI